MLITLRNKMLHRVHRCDLTPDTWHRHSHWACIFVFNLFILNLKNYFRYIASFKGHADVLDLLITTVNLFTINTINTINTEDAVPCVPCDEPLSLPGDQYSEAGQTCLHVAMAASNVACVHLLLRSGADPNKRRSSPDGFTPLLAAVR